MQSNKTKAKLKAGQAVIGCFVRYPEPGIVEVLGYQDWDYILFDAEHGTVEPRDCENLARAAELQGVTSMVRVPMNFQPIILRYMDTGVQGLHIPMIKTREDAELAVRLVKYHPEGARGLAGVRAADYAQFPLGEYVKSANAETMIVAQVETADAIERLPGILAVDGIDVIFIGPNDLAHSLGLPGDVPNPKVQAAMQRIADLVVPSRCALGLMVSNADGARQWIDRGARYISIGMESILTPACRNFLKAARGG